jgi:hypothetical protein
MEQSASGILAHMNTDNVESMIFLEAVVEGNGGDHDFS